MLWTHPSTDRLSYARMVQELITTMQPEEASAMKREMSVVGIDIAKALST
jgi:hypothetical protein